MPKFLYDLRVVNKVTKWSKRHNCEVCDIQLIKNRSKVPKVLSDLV